MGVEYRFDEGRVAHALMDDGKANVLNDASCSGLRTALARASDDGAGCLVVHGTSRMFSGGIDLEIIRGTDPVQRRISLETIAHTLLAMWTAPLPTIAAVTGHAIAGGAILAMACDHRIAVDQEAKIGVNETALGMTFPTWAAVIIEGAVSPSARSEVMLLGRLFDPQGAVRVGILDDVVAAASFDEALAEAAHERAALPTRAYAGNKRVLRAAEAKRAAALVSSELDFASAGAPA
jgi:enoyl-CoA hydratase